MDGSRKPSALRIRCLTYNLNRGKADRNFLELLYDRNLVDSADLPDLYVFSFQELAPLYLTFSSFTTSAIHDRQDDILRAFSVALRTFKDRERFKDGDRSESTIKLHALTYQPVSVELYGGLALLVYARSDTIHLSIKNVDVAKASCGFMNLMNNKGAIGIRLTIQQPEDPSGPNNSPKQRGEELITFVNAHLAAHDSGLLARNQNYQTILNKLLFAPTTRSGKPATIYDSTHLFFMGDLNYRITMSPPGALPNAKISQDQLRQMLQDGPYSSIVSQHDTLTHQHRARSVLDGLREAPIDFKPSYKYIRTEPNQFVDFDHRLPGWTDRIFFASWNDEESSDEVSPSPTDGTSKKTEVLQYRCDLDFFGSDHKPVWAVFDIPEWHPDPSQRLLKFKPFRQRVLPDRWWREKLWIGYVLDRTLGIGLLAILILGFGSMRLGVINMLVVVGWKIRKLLR